MKQTIVLLLCLLVLSGCRGQAPVEKQGQEHNSSVASSAAAPVECSFTEAFECVSYQVAPNSIRLVLKNKLNQEIKNIEIGVYACDIVKKGGSLAPNEQAIYDITCVTGKVGGPYSSAIVINYETDVKHSTLGKLNTVVK